MSNVLFDQLNKDLISDPQIQSHIGSINKSRSNVVVEARIATWLVAWIQKGALDTRTAAVNDYLKNNFHALLGLTPDDSVGIVKSIQGKVGAKAEMIKANLETLNGSTRVLLAGRQPHEFDMMTKSLGQVKGTREVTKDGFTDYKEAINGEMALHFSKLVSQVLDESGIHIDLNSTMTKQADKLQELQKQLDAKLQENAHMFTADFIGHATAQITELKHDTEVFHSPLINNNPKNGLLDALVGKLESEISWTATGNDGKAIDLSKLDDHQLADLIDRNESGNVSKNLENKLAGYLGMQGADVIPAMQSEINNLSISEKALLLIKVRETDAIRSVQKHGSLGELFNKIDFVSLLPLAAIGGIGGLIFGSPVMGIMITALLTFIGKFGGGNSQLTIAPPPPKVDSRSTGKLSAVPA